MSRDYCYITRRPDGIIVIDASYDADFVSDLKRLVPDQDRRWNPDLKTWQIGSRFAAQAERLARHHYGDVIEV